MRHKGKYLANAQLDGLLQKGLEAMGAFEQRQPDAQIVHRFADLAPPLQDFTGRFAPVKLVETHPVSPPIPIDHDDLVARAFTQYLHGVGRLFLRQLYVVRLPECRRRRVKAGGYSKCLGVQVFECLSSFEINQLNISLGRTS